MSLKLNYRSWVVSNVYGWMFGFKFLSPLHHLVANLALHALGYDNGLCSGESRFIKKNLKKADVRICIDVGAYIGNYSSELKKYLPDAIIYAIEPSSSSFTKLEQQEGIKALRFAVADYDGEASLYSKADESETASLEEKIGGARPETVRVASLDSITKSLGVEEIDYVKIDTEGYELEVLKGMSFKPRFVQFEFNLHHLKRDQTLKMLTSKLDGYTFYRLLPHGLLKINPDKWADNVFMFCNIVAIRNQDPLL